MSLGDVDITAVPAHEKIRHGLAFVPQTENIFATLSINDNLLLAADILPKEKRSRRIADLYAMFPDLAERPSRRAGALSGGQRQMLAVARALIVEPSVLILDEPSAGLSPKIVAEVFRKLKEINGQGVTIILVEQNVKAALAIADRAVILVEGRIAPRRRRGGARRRSHRRRTLSRRAARPDSGAAMNPQALMDGLVAGSMIGLGAVGVTLTYSILRFANFAHGEFVAWGAYFALGVAGALGAAFSGLLTPIGPFSFGWALPIAALVAIALNGGARPSGRCAAVWPPARRSAARSSSWSWRASARRSPCAACSNSSSPRSRPISPRRCRSRCRSAAASGRRPTSFCRSPSPPCWSSPCTCF